MTSRWLFRGSLACLCVGAIGCTKSPAPDVEAAKKAGITMMMELKKAAEALDAEKFVSLCLNSPEFAVFEDGKGYGYDEFVKNEREGFRTFKGIQLRWDTLAVKALGADVVAAYAPFHQLLKEKSGAETALKGDVTWIVVRRNGEWKLLYAHAWHFPDQVAK
jgi:hypothetical protein